jgi:PAS domain S-box-containing protein
MLDGMSEGFALLDADFRIVDLNREAMRLDTQSREDLIGRTHWDAYPGSEDSELGNLYKLAMRDRVPVTLEHCYTWPDGQTSWLAMRAYPTDDNGLAIFFRDVSDRREQWQQLRDSEARFRAAIDATHGILWTNDASGRMIGEQPGWAALTGQSFEDYQDYGWTKAVHPDDAAPTVVAWDKAVAETRPFEFEHRVRRHDGVWRRFSIRAIPVLNDAGTIREWVGVHNDITEESAAAQQLVRNAETFETLVRNSPFGINVVDSDLKVLHASEGARRVFAAVNPLLGRDLAEVITLLWAEPFASESISHFRHTLATGESYTSQSINERRRNGDDADSFDWRIDRIVLPSGEYGVVCYFYDLSERVALEGKLQQALDDKDMLIREIDHRVRNSLSMVSAFLAMQGASASSPDIKQALAVAGARLSAVARVHERLYKSTTIGVVEFGGYLDDICHDLQALLHNDRISMHATTVPIEMPVDKAVPLGLITNELVINAFKHCGPDCARIDVDLARDSTGIVLTISNDGAGMPSHFDPKSNRGLGMQVVALLVQQLNGTIAMPAAGEPARFVITVPV